jgi:uncharacterized DUF497 family protein
MRSGIKMGLVFEWDKKKAKTNIAKHDVSFNEASTVFRDTLSLTIKDPLHSDEEDRYIIIGESIKLRLLVVVHTVRNDRIRIINARRASKKERRYYEYK